jgi:hypothetical protein
MPLHDRVAGIWMGAVIDMDIRAAHADALNLQQYLPGSRFWLFDLAEFDYPGAGHDRLLHRILLLISCGCGMIYPLHQS